MPSIKHIEEKDYASGIEELGDTEIIKIGIGFFRKNCKVLISK